jgi:hypothetical protein
MALNLKRATVVIAYGFVARVLLQRSHTSWGTMPTRMRRAKTLHPRHSPRADSKKAATAKSPKTAWAAPQ